MKSQTLLNRIALKSREYFQKGMFNNDKRGMINVLVGIGYGLVAFGILIGVGLIVLSKFLGTMTASTAEANATTYVIGQFGESGLAGWIPAVIAVVVGALILGYFAIRGGGKGRSY